MARWAHPGPRCAQSGVQGITAHPETQKVSTGLGVVGDPLHAVIRSHEPASRWMDGMGTSVWAP